MKKRIYTVAVYFEQKPGCTSCSRGSSHSSTYSWWEAIRWASAARSFGHWAEVY